MDTRFLYGQKRLALEKSVMRFVEYFFLLSAYVCE